MAKSFHLTVARVGENIFEGDAVSVSAQGSEGMFQILAGHEAFVSDLVKGEIQVKAADEQMYHFETPHGGLVEVSHAQVTVLL